MILLDIGNTHTRIACAEGEKITLLRTLKTAELTAAVIPADPEGVWGASVVPAAAAKLPDVRFINASLAGKILDFSCVDSSTIGADRLANAVAALDYGTPALVLDCGSAVTIELVDEELRFRGGAIAPGRKMLRQALHANTAQLPEIPLSSRLPVFPGPNTVEALRFGIDRTPHASYVMNLTIGIIVIALCIFSVVKDIIWKDKDTVPKHWAFAVACGLFAGITTQLANAAGPVMAIYLLAMRFDKKEYMGTAAWYFMILNWIKLPIFWSEGRITKASFLADMGMIPFLLLGAVLGIVLLKKLPQKVFEKAVLFLSGLAAIKLLIP